MSTTIEEDTVILQLDKGTYFGLEGVGPRMWELLDDEPSTDEVVAAIVEEFEVDRETAREEIVEFLTVNFAIESFGNLIPCI